MPDYLGSSCATTTSSSSTCMPSNLYTLSSPTIYFTASDDTKEYIEKTDKHIDELEEDIDFLNEKRKELESEISLNKCQIDGLKKDIDELKKAKDYLMTIIGDLENKLDFYIAKYENMEHMG